MSADKALLAYAVAARHHAYCIGFPQACNRRFSVSDLIFLATEARGIDVSLGNKLETNEGNVKPTRDPGSSGLTIVVVLK